MAAGENLVIRSNIGNTLRTAGADVVLSGKVKHDVLIAAGNARITKTASVNGDLLFFGANLIVEGSVSGKILANGERIYINSHVGSVDTHARTLILGDNAVVDGTLRYASVEKATMSKNAKVHGQIYYQPVERRKEATGLAAIFSLASLYKVFLDIILSIAVIVFLPFAVKRILEVISKSPVASAGTGFIFLTLWPLLSFVLLILLWLGIASFLFYGLILIFSLVMSKIVIGWYILHWWYGRKDKEKSYTVDWKSGLVGSVSIYILLLLPVFGWIVGGLIYLITLGGIVKTIFSFMRTPRTAPKN
jgi:cytoskeletal protein CcmA (bactofilin family)